MKINNKTIKTLATVIITLGISFGSGTLLNNIDEDKAIKNTTAWLEKHKDDHIITTAKTQDNDLNEVLQRCHSIEDKVIKSKYITDKAKKQLLDANKINKRKAINKNILQCYFNYSDEQIKDVFKYEYTQSYLLNDENFNKNNISKENIKNLKKKYKNNKETLKNASNDIKRKLKI